MYLVAESRWLCIGFVEGGKPENPEKNPRSKEENQQQTQPTCDAGSGNRTRATAVGGQAPVVQRLDNAIQRINRYPADKSLSSG